MQAAQGTTGRKIVRELYALEVALMRTAGGATYLDNLVVFLSRQWKIFEGGSERRF